MKLVLAPHVEFDEAKHEYWYKGKQLSGVTGLIAKKLGIKMPQEFVEEHQEEGIHVHKAVQKWIETGDSGSIHPGVRWLIDTFVLRVELARKSIPWRKIDVYSEVLVSDLKQYASAVDVVVAAPELQAVSIFDIKKGVFKREYVTWQLSIYKYFIEKYTDIKVGECVCICIRDREYYDIFPKSYEQVEKLLYGNN
jgi:hypothetical protein